MDRTDYLNVRNSKQVSLQTIYETLLLNPTFKVKSFELFVTYYKALSSLPINVNSVLIAEFKRLNDHRFTITTLHDKNNKEIDFY